MQLIFYMSHGQREFFIRWLTTKNHFPDLPNLVIRYRLCILPAGHRDRGCTLVDEFVVHQCQSLRSHDRDITLPAGHRGITHIKRRHHGRQQTALSKDVETSAMLVGFW